MGRLGDFRKRKDLPIGWEWMKNPAFYRRWKAHEAARCCGSLLRRRKMSPWRARQLRRRDALYFRHMRFRPVSVIRAEWGGR